MQPLNPLQVPNDPTTSQVRLPLHRIIVLDTYVGNRPSSRALLKAAVNFYETVPFSDDLYGIKACSGGLSLKTSCDER